MRRIFLFLSIVSVLLLTPGMVCKTVAKQYQGQCGDSISWSLNTADSVLHLVGSGAMTVYSKSTEVPWDTLRSYVKHAEIDERITNVYFYSFSTCSNLQELIIPKGCVRQPSVQNCTSLRKIRIAEKANLIDFGTFAGCVSLDSVYLPDNITSIAQQAFCQMKSLPYLSVSKNLTKIAGLVFYGTQIHTLEYRGDVADICKMSTNSSFFSDSTHLYINSQEVTDLYVPDSVQEIKDNVFANFTNLRHASFHENTVVAPNAFTGCFISIDMRRDGKDNIVGEERKKLSTDLQYHYTRQGRYISFSGSGDMPNYYGSSPWNEDYLLDSIYLPNGMTSIGSNAFAGHEELKHITWNYSINTIGDSAFMNCKGLADTLTIPISADTVFRHAFAGCDSLREIRYYKYLDIHPEAFPDQAHMVELDTFKGVWYNNVHYCLALQDSVMTYEGEGGFAYNNQVYYDWAFIRDKVKHVYIIGGITNVPNHLMGSAANLETVYLCDSVRTIDAEPFGQCGNLTKVHSSKNLKSIGWRAFMYCGKLDSIELPETVEYIDGMAFYVCKSLPNLKLPKHLKTIKYDAFSGCASMRGELYIPDSVTTIGARAFATGKNGITSVRLPKSIEKIEDKAFMLDSLTTFRYAGTVEDWIKVSLGNANANPSYYAHQIYFEENRVPQAIHFSDTVESIGAYTFVNDTLLKEVSYYKHTAIGTDAFLGTGANIIIKDQDKHTTDAMIHGSFTANSKEDLKQMVFTIKQKKTRKTIKIVTDKSGRFYLDWDNGTYTAAAGNGPHRMPLDDIGSVVIISIDPSTSATSGDVTYKVDVEVSGLPSVGQYPYNLHAITEYREETIEYRHNKIGEEIEIVHRLGEQTDHLVAEGVINTDDDATISYWGGDNFFMPTENTDVYDELGRYLSKWYPEIPSGIYIIREGDKACKWGR